MNSLQNFLVESVLHLRDEEAATAKDSLMELISFIALAGQTSTTKRERPDWSPEANRASIAK